MIVNAHIVDADIFVEQSGVLTFALQTVSGNNKNKIIGLCYLDWNDGEQIIPAPYTATVLRSVIETIGAESWKNLVGKYLRYEDNDDENSTVFKIGNILEDKWIDLRELTNLNSSTPVTETEEVPTEEPVEEVVEA